MAQKRVAIVGAGAYQAQVVRKARELGWYTLAIDSDPEAPALGEADAGEAVHADDWHAVVRLAERHGVDGIYSAAEWAVETVACATWELGLPGLSPEAARCVRDKAAMRDTFAAKGLPNPPFRAVETLAQAEAVGHELGTPLIVRPGDGASGQGTVQVDHVADLSLAFCRVLKNARCTKVLVEAVMQGEVVGVDTLAYEGDLAVGGILGKEKSEAPYRYDRSLYMPAKLGPSTGEAVLQAARGALDAIGFGHGGAHLEVALTPNGPRVMEIAGSPGPARLPADLIQLSYGNDFLADSLRVAVGQPLQEHRLFERGSAIFWISSDSGIVTAVEGLDEARAVFGVERVVVEASPGDLLGHIVDSATRDRVGYVLALGDTVDDATRAAERARDLCRIVTRPTR